LPAPRLSGCTLTDLPPAFRYGELKGFGGNAPDLSQGYGKLNETHPHIDYLGKCTLEPPIATHSPPPASISTAVADSGSNVAFGRQQGLEHALSDAKHDETFSFQGDAAVQGHPQPVQPWPVFSCSELSRGAAEDHRKLMTNRPPDWKANSSRRVALYSRTVGCPRGALCSCLPTV
jgi:hypothetical protein